MKRSFVPPSLLRNTVMAVCIQCIVTIGLIAQAPGPSLGPSSEPAAADAAAAAPTDGFFVDTIDVEVVNVEVYVTDKAGNPVTDLTAADFEIREDGRLHPVVNFYATVDGAPARLSGEDALALGRVDVPKVSEGEVWTPPSEAEQQLHLIVYFDNLFLKPATRNKVVGEVERFLYSRLRRGDRAMLVTYDRGLHVRQSFTDQVDLLVEKLSEVERLTGFAAQAATERRQVLERVETSRDGFEAESHVDFFAKSLHFDVQQSIKGLDELVESLAGLPGRKALLYVSDGLPMTAAEDLFHLLELRHNDSGGPLQAQRYRSRRAFNDLVAKANANRVTFYTLEATGLRGHQSLSAEYGRIDSQDLIEIEAIRDATIEEPLVMMAAGTGGLAALNTNDLDGALGNMSRDFGTYYSLGYRPTHLEEGRYHQIEVEIPGRKGLKIRHRRGYRDKTQEARLRESTTAALLYGVADNRIGLKMRFSPIRAADDGDLLLPVEVHIPIGELALLPRGGLHEGRLRVSTAAIDARGRISQPTQQQVPLRIPDGDIEVARGQFFVYEAQLRMRRGSHRVAVLVYDELAGQTSAVQRSVEVGR